MIRGNWFITNVVGKICQNLNMKLDRDFRFATLKSVCVEELCLPFGLHLCINLFRRLGNILARFEAI